MPAALIKAEKDEKQRKLNILIKISSKINQKKTAHLEEENERKATDIAIGQSSLQLRKMFDD